MKVWDLCKSFAGMPALSRVSFSLGEDEILGVIGPSGGGKSTLLRCLNLLEFADSGEIEYWAGLRFSGPNFLLRKDERQKLEGSSDGVLAALRQNIGYVSQRLSLWEERSVLENLTLGPRIVLGQSSQEAENRAMKLCEGFGLSDKLTSRAWQLSGGQRQRVAFLRAMMMSPRLLLLDEVTSALDPILTFDVMEKIQGLRASGLAMILVTHHLEFASRICDRLLFLSRGEVVQADTPEKFRNSPATGEVERFLGILSVAR